MHVCGGQVYVCGGQVHVCGGQVRVWGRGRCMHVTENNIAAVIGQSKTPALHAPIQPHPCTTQYLLKPPTSAFQGSPAAA